MKRARDWEGMSPLYHNAPPRGRAENENVRNHDIFDNLDLVLVDKWLLLISGSPILAL